MPTNVKCNEIIVLTLYKNIHTIPNLFTRHSRLIVSDNEEVHDFDYFNVFFISQFHKN